MTLETVPFDVIQLAESVLSDLKIVANKKNVALKLVVGQGFQRNWLGDPVRVRQVLLNITSNAVKFTNEGQVTIRLIPEKELSFSIKDTGIGMSREELKSLYNRFEQADQSTTRKYGGTGLGMAITEKLILQMEGQIQVTSEVAVGSDFYVSIPLETPELEQIAQMEQHEAETAPCLNELRILLAEDNEINQFIFDSMIAPTGCELKVASNGQEAVHLAAKYPPDIIFMDIQMPVMDGVEAFRIIRATNPDVPIIALTANMLDSDIQLYKEEGFNAYMGKPIEIDQLFKLLGRFSKKSGVTASNTTQTSSVE